MSSAEHNPTPRQRLISALTRRYPFLSGCGSFANSSPVRIAAGLGHDSHSTTVWTQLDTGEHILVPIADYIGRAVFFAGDLDRKITQTLRRIVRPGDRVVDIGANLGLVTLRLATLVGPHGIVHSFEPNPAMVRLLTDSIARNAFANVRLHDIALGEAEGIATLAIPTHNAGMGTLNPARADSAGGSVQVTVRTFSSLADELDLRNIRLMKIDVEGFELQVLRGALAWMKTSPPDVLLLETSETPEESQPVISLLQSLNYALYNIPKRWLSLRLTPFQPGAQAPSSHDMLAIRKPCEDEVVSKFRCLGVQHYPRRQS